jgi:hypothetical protein
MNVYLAGMMKLQRMYGKELDNDILEEYINTISKRINEAQFLKVFDSVRDTFVPTSACPFPLIPHFLKPMREEDKQSIEHWMQDLQVGIADGKKTLSSMGIQDKNFIKAVMTLGGPYNLKNWTEKDWQFKKNQIKDAYESNLRKESRKNERKEIENLNIKGLQGIGKF